jgi:hypothetical protein
MAPLRVSTTKSEWLPDDPTAFVPTRLWKFPFITTWDDSRNQNRPTDSAEEAELEENRSCEDRTRFVGSRIGVVSLLTAAVLGNYCCAVVCTRWRGVGIFSLARVARGPFDPVRGPLRGL